MSARFDRRVVDGGGGGCMLTTSASCWLAASFCTAPISHPYFSLNCFRLIVRTAYARDPRRTSGERWGDGERKRRNVRSTAGEDWAGPGARLRGGRGGEAAELDRAGNAGMDGKPRGPSQEETSLFAGQRRFHLGNLDELNPKRLFEALDKLGDLGLHPVEPRLNCVPGRGGSTARQARGADRVRNVSCTESI